MNKKI
jgi:DNA-directed RNA polymerase, mitochondrial